MSGEVIKEFLVSLGFGVDDNSLKSFNKAIDNAYVRIGIMAAGVTAAAGTIFAGVSDISGDFEKMGYEYRIIAPMINKTLMMRQALLRAYGDAGINITKAVQQSVLFNFSLAKLKFQLDGIYKSVGMKFIPTLTKQMDIFRGKVVANMPKILKFLEGMVKFVFKAFEGVTVLGTRLWSMLMRVWEVFKDLDKATDGWSTKIFMLIAAWKILNLAFLTSPIGILITSIIALIALYDDFMVWKEGGESLIDWGNGLSATLGILAGAIAAIAPILWVVKAAMTAWSIATNAAGAIATAFSTIMSVVRTAVLLFNLALTANPIGVVIVAIAALGAAAYGVYKNWDKLKSWFTSFFDWIGEKFNLLAKVKDFFGGNSSQNVNINKTTTAPLGANGGSAQNIVQKTEINVQTNDDPTDIADAVMGQQNKVNFNMARNMKGASR
jgi:hypothetical protein